MHLFTLFTHLSFGWNLWYIIKVPVYNQYRYNPRHRRVASPTPHSHRVFPSHRATRESSVRVHALARRVRARRRVPARKYPGLGFWTQPVRGRYRGCSCCKGTWIALTWSCPRSVLRSRCWTGILIACSGACGRTKRWTRGSWLWYRLARRLGLGCSRS